MNRRIHHGGGQAWAGQTMRTSVALVLAATSQAAQAQFVEGNALAEVLRKSKHTTHANYYEGYYYGYVLGVADAFIDHLWCPPGEVTQGQITTVVEKYLQANPQNWHMPAASLVLNGLNQAFPCKKTD